MATRRSSSAETTWNGASLRTSAGWYGARRTRWSARSIAALSMLAIDAMRASVDRRLASGPGKSDTV